MYRSIPKLREARKALENGDFDKARELTDPLVKRKNPEAILIRGSFSDPLESTIKFERRYKHSIESAANRKYAPAIYWLGAFYDMGKSLKHLNIHSTRKKQQVCFE